MYGKTLAQFPERLEGFLQVLAAVPLAAMDAGFAECLNTCSEFPVPQDVLTAATKWQLEHRDDETTRKLLDRPDKPAEFTSLADAATGVLGQILSKGIRDDAPSVSTRQECAAVAKVRAALKERDLVDFPWLADPTRHQSGPITKEQIAIWLQEGKDKGRARLRECEADPVWRTQAARFGVPGYRNPVVAEVSVVPSTVPKDPEERRSWARDKAIAGGWIEGREPGAEG